MLCGPSLEPTPASGVGRRDRNAKAVSAGAERGGVRECHVKTGEGHFRTVTKRTARVIRLTYTNAASLGDKRPELRVKTLDTAVVAHNRLQPEEGNNKLMARDYSFLNWMEQMGEQEWP